MSFRIGFEKTGIFYARVRDRGGERIIDLMGLRRYTEEHRAPVLRADRRILRYAVIIYVPFRKNSVEIGRIALAEISARAVYAENNDAIVSDKRSSLNTFGVV